MSLPVKSVCPTCNGCRVASMVWYGNNTWRLMPCPACCCEVCGETTDTPPLCRDCDIADDAAYERRCDR